MVVAVPELRAFISSCAVVTFTALESSASAVASDAATAEVEVGAAANDVK